MKRMARYIGIGALVVVAALFLAWVTSPDPKFNPASFEATPLVETVAPMDEASTLAQFVGEAGETITLQVIGVEGETITGINLADMGASNVGDPFLALASISAPPLSAETVGQFSPIKVSMARLLPSGSAGTQHIGTGTNFPEHAEEANSASVFRFPKFGPVTPARTEVVAEPGVLLDYEVELCIRFDRDITSVADFNAAVKGVFLCADFTNRNAIVNLVNPDNLDSGYGFSDAKSGPDFYPTGPFLVIPKDWRAFTANERMTTSVNNQPRQDARGSEMTMDFGELVAASLADMTEQRFYYAGDFYRLAPNNRISKASSLMSGTAEGVIFTPPTRGDYVEALLAYILAGGPFSGKSLIDIAKAKFIAIEDESGHFLQPGDVVWYRSSHLGNIMVKVTSPK